MKKNAVEFLWKKWHTSKLHILTHFDIKVRSSELSKMISMTVGVFQEVNKITSHYLIIIIIQTNLKALNF